MRKTILFYISIAAAAVLMASLSAYLIDSDTAANNFRIGTNTIEAKEEFTTPAIGEITAKTPRVENTGKVYC